MISVRRVISPANRAAATVLIGAICLAAVDLGRLRAEPPATGSFEIPAYAFDRGNAKTFIKQYADAGPMVANGGVSPNVVEYDIVFPADGGYTISIKFAAQDPRPVDLYLDEMKIATCCRTATGTWNTSSAAWEKSATVYIAPGKHTIKLQRGGAFPHLMSLKFESSRPFPKVGS